MSDSVLGGGRGGLSRGCVSKSSNVSHCCLGLARESNSESLLLADETESVSLSD